MAGRRLSAGVAGRLGGLLGWPAPSAGSPARAGEVSTWAVLTSQRQVACKLALGKGSYGQQGRQLAGRRAVSKRMPTRPHLGQLPNGCCIVLHGLSRGGVELKVCRKRETLERRLPAAPTTPCCAGQYISTYSMSSAPAMQHVPTTNHQPQPAHWLGLQAVRPAGCGLGQRQTTLLAGRWCEGAVPGSPPPRPRCRTAAGCGGCAGGRGIGCSGWAQPWLGGRCKRWQSGATQPCHCPVRNCNS